MALEWLIDLIKEWVLSLAYATEAWVLEWVTPIHVLGTLDPDATCTYHKAGTLNGQPYYIRNDGAWFLWWDGTNTWFVSPELETLGPPVFYRKDPTIEGTYLPDAGATGTATVASGYGCPKKCSVDRGDPAVYDWDIGDLTIDGAWHDLDLSAIVPAGAKGVLFNLYVRATAINKSLTLRENGNVNAINTAGIIPPVANVFYRNDSIVSCDIDRKIEYVGDAGFFNAIYIVVRKWWF